MSNPKDPQDLQHSEAGNQPASAPVFLILGKILRPHGIRGEMRLKVITDYPERIAHLDRVFVGTDPYDADSAEAYGIASARRNRDGLLIQLEGVNDRNEAERFRDLLLMVSLDDAVPLEDDEYYVYEILGARAVTPDGEDLGQISEVLETGANDVFVIQGGIYGEILLPDIPDVILNIDLDNKIVTVSPPPGLMPDSH